MAAIWSTRFLVTINASEWLYYTVPAGKLAVVRSVVAGAAEVQAKAYVSAAGGYIFAESLPGTLTSRSVEMRVVLYPGERIGAMCTHVNANVSVHGYLFTQPVAQLEPPEAVPGPPPPGFVEVGELPAGST